MWKEGSFSPYILKEIKKEGSLSPYIHSAGIEHVRASQVTDDQLNISQHAY